jgi:hypothetical protein
MYLKCTEFIILVPSDYIVSTDSLNWGAARAACKKKGMDLAVAETLNEFNCINDKIAFAGTI